MLKMIFVLFAICIFFFSCIPDNKMSVLKSKKVENQKLNSKLDSKEEVIKVTMTQENAIRVAKNYLSMSGYSKTGLIETLKFDFSQEDAVYAADNVGADWIKQVEKKAKFYLNMGGISKNLLIELLELDGFPQEDVANVIGIIGVDWNKQAEITAKKYLDLYNESTKIDLDMPIISRNDLIEHLNFRGFTSEQVTFGVHTVGF